MARRDKTWKIWPLLTIRYICLAGYGTICCWIADQPRFEEGGSFFAGSNFLLKARERFVHACSGCFCYEIQRKKTNTETFLSISSSSLIFIHRWEVDIWHLFVNLNIYDNAEGWVRIINIVQDCKNKNEEFPQVVIATVTCPMRFISYPFDRHSCPFLFGSYTYEHTFMVFHTDMSFLTTWDFPFFNVCSMCLQKSMT